MSLPQITPKSLADYLGAMSRAVFTSGISWQVVDAKWDGIQDAFARFDPMKVAAFTPQDVERLMGDERVIRNRKKIEAVVRNAGEIIVTEREFGGFGRYLESFNGDNEALVRDLHKRFAYLGESVAHFFLFFIGFDMPSQEKWAHAHFGESHPHHRRG